MKSVEVGGLELPNGVFKTTAGGGFGTGYIEITLESRPATNVLPAQRNFPDVGRGLSAASDDAGLARRNPGPVLPGARHRRFHADAVARRSGAICSAVPSPAVGRSAQSRRYFARPVYFAYTNQAKAICEAVGERKRSRCQRLRVRNAMVPGSSLSGGKASRAVATAGSKNETHASSPTAAFLPASGRQNWTTLRPWAIRLLSWRSRWQNTSYRSIQ